MSAREMRCTEAKELFSPYLDGAVTGRQMLGGERHLTACAGCQREYRLLRETQRMLVSVGRPKTPEDLGLKLRLAISREAAHARRPLHCRRVRLGSLPDALIV